MIPGTKPILKHDCWKKVSSKEKNKRFWLVWCKEGKASLMAELYLI